MTGRPEWRSPATISAAKGSVLRAAPAARAHSAPGGRWVVADGAVFGSGNSLYEAWCSACRLVELGRDAAQSEAA